jgi:hypothetical protein
MTLDRTSSRDSLDERLIAQPVSQGVTSWNGQTGDVVGTLANIFAFGLGAGAVADNVFAQPTGNMRWSDTTFTNAFAMPGQAFYETNGLATDESRVGVWLGRRWTSNARPSTTFRTDVIFNSAYVGTPLDGTEWVVDTEYLTSNGAETGVTGDQYAKRRYQIIDFFNNQPMSQPSAGAAAGVSSVEYTDLYNGSAGGEFAITRLLNGWGQESVFTKPQLAGVTPSFFSWYDPTRIADAIGNGTGFFMGQGIGTNFGASRLTGGVDSHMLAANFAGAWGLGLWAFDGVSPGVLTRVATFDTVSGATMPIPFLQLSSKAAALTPAQATGVEQSFLTQEIDLTANSAPVASPTRPGFFFVPDRFAYIFTAAAGTLTTPPTTKYGNNATLDNWLATSAVLPTAAMVATAVATGVGYSGYSGMNRGPLVDMATPATFTISSPAVGVGLTLKAKLLVIGLWVPNTFPS